MFSFRQVDYNVFVADISRDVTSQQLLVCCASNYQNFIFSLSTLRTSFNSTISRLDMLKVVEVAVLHAQYPMWCLCSGGG